MIEWDINEYVWVKLTDRGRQIHREITRGWPIGCNQHSGVKQSYTPPASMRWLVQVSCWYLMKIFGPHIGPSADPLFKFNRPDRTLHRYKGFASKQARR